MLLVAGLAACGDAFAPEPSTDFIAVGQLDSEAVFAFPQDLNTVLAESAPVSRTVGQSDTAGSSIYFRGAEGTTGMLVRLGLPDLSHESVPLDSFVGADPDLSVSGANVLVSVPGPDGARLVLDGSTSQGTQTLNVVEPGSRSIVATRLVDRLGTGAVARVAGGSGGTELLALFSSGAQASLVRLGAESLSVRDSVPIDLEVATSAQPRELWLGRGSTVYFISGTTIYAADALTGDIVGETERFTSSRIAVGPSLDIVVQTQPGDGFSSPGTGQVHVYDADLSPLRVLDTLPAEGGFPLRLTDVRVDEANRAVFVAGGTRAGGQLFPNQLAQILILDLDTGAVDAFVGLGVNGIPRFLPSR